MQLNILSAEQKIFEGTIHSITLPGELGPFQILKNHAPLVSNLIKGKVTYVQGTTHHNIMIKEGMVKVENNQVTLLITPA